MDAERVPVQPIWTKIAAENPDVLMLLGDQIYMDWGDLGGSGWRKIIGKDEAKGLLAFATEMHRRYALQWGVTEFRDLICGFTHRNDTSRFLMTWDDHDFAWNNAVIDDGSSHNDVKKHGVPPKVKAISYALFKQFERQLRQANFAYDYPALSLAMPGVMEAGLPSDGLFWQGNLANTGPDCLLLDTRWHRQPRTNTASILGPAQLAAVTAAVSTPHQGLLIVAAGTPMAYKYRFSQQAWYAHEGIDSANPPYTDYAQILQNAQRPVLYLAGDVHRNAWSGRLPKLDGSVSSVVQVLSSGAAIDNIGPKRFAPSYGVVTFPANPAANHTVKIQLISQDRELDWHEQPTIGNIDFSNNDWVEPMDGAAAALVDAPADTQPLTVLCARARKSEFYKLGVQLAIDDEIEGFDVVYKSEAQKATSLPEPLLVEVVNSMQMKLTFQGDSYRGDNRETEIENALTAAFDRALASPAKTSVVLLIHGVGKSFSQNLSQAYQLRKTYPHCEPILYSWEAGGSGGALSALVSVGAAQKSAQVGALGLYKVLSLFAQIAKRDEYARLAKIIVARSAGSLALHETLVSSSNQLTNQLSSITRIILSAPLMKVKAFDRKASFSGLNVPIVITRNKNDQTLNFADWIDGFGTMLGLKEGWRTTRPSHCCIDFTNCDSVGSLHDYLFLNLSTKQLAINNLLFAQAAFNLAAAVNHGLLTNQGDGVFNVPSG
jgi:alkaline phosphatase D